MEREIRIISIKGRYLLSWCMTDGGYVEQVLLEEPDLKFASLQEMKDMIAAVQKAGSAAITVINASNRKELLLEGMEGK